MSWSISVFGLGKLGACMAAVFADRGMQVVGFDLNPAVINAVNGGRAPVYEPDLEQLIAVNAQRLSATADSAAAVLASDVTFIVVPTPSLADSSYSVEFVVKAGTAIGRALRQKDTYHVVVLTSTVMPGATTGSLLAAIEQASDKRCGVDFGVCYSPEFIALGTVIRDFQNPDFVLIGESDAQAGEILAACYREVVGRTKPIFRTSIVNAEVAKLGVNAFITTKISFANMLAEMCERLEGADVDAVTAAIGLDSRIGSKYIRGGAPFGGPCFPRDNRALGYVADLLGARASLAQAADAENERQLQRIVQIIEAHAGPGTGVSILGVTYKPGSVVLDASPGLLLAEALQGRHRVACVDPLSEALRADWREPFSLYSPETWKGDDQSVAVIVNPDQAFADDAFVAKLEARPRIVVDCWRLLRGRDLTPTTTYVPLGIGPQPGAYD